VCVQEGILLPGVIHHIRLMASLSAFERTLPSPFVDKELLKQVSLFPLAPL
jgi:hypothetical protein